MTTNTITIHFMDDKHVSVTVPKEKTDEFMTKLRDGEAYIDTTVESGVWIPTGNIRYSHISPTQLQPITTETDETIEEQIEAITGPQETA